MTAALLLFAALAQTPAAPSTTPQPETAAQEAGLPPREDLRFPGERHFGVIRRLTTRGENAEGYFSFAGDRITYQATVGARKCDQIYELDLLTGARRMVSTGKGRTTCSYFLPDDHAILFASTHEADDGCLPPPDRSHGYVWKIYPQYDLYVRDLDTWELKPLAHAPGYDAEAVISPDGKKIVFTSRRHGDLDIYLMNVDGTGITQLTDELGYDGGPFFSPDSTRIVYRAYHPKDAAAQEHYRELLDQDEIEPMALQIMLMDLDGGHKRQITHNRAANFAPYFHPDGKHIVYCSNEGSPDGRGFDIYMIDTEGGGKETITTNPSFDGFPMFSPDGTRFIFASNRANASPHETNLFLAEWIEQPAPKMVERRASSR